MISALRKIENRGDLEGATSAVMERCVDNPREGFAALFATHPSVENRVAALVQYAGGHDPGPLDLEPPQEGDTGDEQAQEQAPASLPPEGNREPGSFLPNKPPIELGAPAPGGQNAGPLPIPGPWGPPRRD
jgi:heat shock protein HtpX